MKKRKDFFLYKAIKALVRLFSPKMEVVGAEKLPDEPVLVVANHCQMYGPIAAELYYPGQRYTWCAGEMMELKEVPAYAFRDFWSAKKPWCRWFFKLLSYLIAPLSVCVFNNAQTIPVWHDARLLHTFRDTRNKLMEGYSVVVFPENDPPYNHILSTFQDKFIDIAKLYYGKTGKELRFVPMYIAPELGQMMLGEPVCFDAAAPIRDERRRICKYLTAQVTALAEALPEHKVVPYRQCPKRRRPSNIPKEETQHEKAGDGLSSVPPETNH